MNTANVTAKAVTYYESAKEALKQNDLISGIAQLTQALALDESLHEARLLRSQVLLTIGDVTSADEDCRWLTEHIGEREDVLMLAIKIAMAKGDKDAAIYIYNKVLEKNPALLAEVNGEFVAEGEEHRAAKNRMFIQKW
jgi:Tfp pilus assembly protein PilF